MRFLLPPVSQAGVGIAYGSGTVIARQAHSHLGHPGAFEACAWCQGTTWAPDRDGGVLVTAADDRVVEDSALIRRLLVS